MPTTITEYTQAVQERTLDAVRQGQDAIVGAVGAWAQAVESAIPATPAFPYADGIPSAQELIETSFGFAEQLLKAQRAFAENVLAAAAPVLEKARPEAAAA
jgi:hypothetical protein